MTRNKKSDAKYMLLTGATGLLGRYLVRDLTLAGVPLAVVVRPTRQQTAHERVESLMRFWDAELGTTLPRPVVLTGELSEESLGLEAEEIRWAAENCRAIIHNAASLSFVATGPESEPFRSNVGGTRNVLQFCQEASIHEFHHVSTAYVCGLRKGVVYESELDEGQEFGNPYEESKVQAEKMVREARFIDSLTVYRPGIIVGDGTTGFTNTFHGFYAAVQLTHTLSGHSVSPSDETGCSDHYPNRITLDGTERKNFVTVDWVSAVMSHILTHPEHYGTTYHLTPRNPVITKTLKRALMASTHLFGPRLIGHDAVVENPSELESFFYDHIHVYNSYWRNDPTFDTSNTQSAAPHLPCPYIDYQKLLFLARKAIEMNFSWRDKRVKLERKTLVSQDA